MSKTILVGNKIKPTRLPTRTEHVNGTAYVFANKHNDGHFVAEVSIPADAELMLSQPHHFYPYPPDAPRMQRGKSADADAQALAEAAEKARKEAEQKAAQEAADKAAAEEAEAKAKAAAAAGEAPPELVAEAKALIEHDEKKIGTEMQKLTSVEVLPIALKLEEAAEKPRAKVVKLLADAVAMTAGEPPKA